MVSISQFQREEIETVRKLIWEYLSAANEDAKIYLKRSADIGAMFKSSLSELEKFSPPSGRLFLAKVDGKAAGIGSFKQIREDACVIKRMYVRPEHRGQNLGKKLLDALIEAAKEIGYKKIMLDSAFFMKAAHSLYYAAGFKEIDPFPEAEMPVDFYDHMVFMELEL